MPVNEKFKIVCKAEEAEITLYDVIDPWWGVSASVIRDALKDAGKISTIRLRINSPGGSIFEGTAIYNLLKSHEARVLVTVDGLAASMASVVAMAGDEIEMGEGAYLMVHDPTGYMRGDSEEMRKMADLLDAMKSQLVDIYSRRTGRTTEDIIRMMSEETWMTAAEAVKEKFADRTVPGLAVAASYDLARFGKVPEVLCQNKEQAMPEAKPAQPGPATLKELKDAFPKTTADWRETQIEANATIDQARNAYVALAEKRAEDAEAKAVAAEKARTEAEAKAATAAAATAASGVTVQHDGGNAKKFESGDPIAVWNKAVADLVASGLARPKAISKLAKEEPEMHVAYLDAYTQLHASARSRVK